MDWESPAGAGIIAAIIGAAGAALVAIGKGIAWLAGQPAKIIRDQREQLVAEARRRQRAERERDDLRTTVDRMRDEAEQCETEREELRAVLEAMGLPGRKLSVVVVDDEPLFRGWMRSHLERIGVEVLAVADNGEEGVLAALDHRPDVVLMDLRMPGGINGIEATRQIVGAWPEARVLVLTGGSSEDHQREAIKAGALACLQKHETDSAALLAQLTRAMRGRR